MAPLALRLPHLRSRIVRLRMSADTVGDMSTQDEQTAKGTGCRHVHHLAGQLSALIRACRRLRKAARVEHLVRSDLGRYGPGASAGDRVPVAR